MNNSTLVFLISIVSLSLAGAYTFLIAIPAEEQVEINAAQEAADSWDIETDCDKILLSQSKILSERDFIGKEIITESLVNAVDRNGCLGLLWTVPEVP